MPQGGCVEIRNRKLLGRKRIIQFSRRGKEMNYEYSNLSKE
jgi:hypothetical protein